MISKSKMLVAVVGAALASITPSATAFAQISGASVSLAGSTANGGGDDDSRRSSVAIQTNDGTTLKSRFAWNLSADETVFSSVDVNGTAQHNLSFNVTAPGAYFLTVNTQRMGDLNRLNDAGGCDGAADITGVTGSLSGGTLTSGTLNLIDPGAIDNGGATTNGPINQSSTARVDNTSNGAQQSHSLSFVWTGSVRSNSCEAAVRLGEGSSVSGCEACVYPGSPSRTDTTDGHFVTVTFTSLCGNGVVDAAQGEQCDTAVAGNVCCDSTCHFITGGVCRPAAGTCDVAESCSGSSGACPANGFVSSTTVCRPATGGVCDAAENCTGSAAACPSDIYLGTTTTCRPSAGVCDVAEVCSGSSPTCPANGFASSSTSCRPSAGVCDVAENCTGSGAACPANAFQSSTTVCRGAAGVCDIEETCTGSNAACPADGKSTAVCRPAGGICDAAESCDGITNPCPSDALAPTTTVCRAASGVCDAAETCDGVGIVCPADTKSTAVCRPVAGVCDAAETCDGVANTCPADAFQPNTVQCRVAAGVCDVAETCDGASANCPPDAVAPATTVCRPDAGECDVAETCDGSGVTCPANAIENDGTTCSDGNSCTLDDVCVAGACTGDSMLCGDGVVQGGCGEQCDDSNLTAHDGCSPTCQVELGLACSPTPLTGCRHPFISGKSSLQISKKGGVKDTIKWKWLKGERTDYADWGTPLSTTNYEVCIYDPTGLQFAIRTPAGGSCAGKPCWRASTKGYTYQDKDLTPDGAYQLKLSQGALAKAQIQFTAKGTALALPGDLTTLSQPLTVQIQNGNGLCWEAVYSSPPTSQSPIKFSDKAD